MLVCCTSAVHLHSSSFNMKSILILACLAKNALAFRIEVTKCSKMASACAVLLSDASIDADLLKASEMSDKMRVGPIFEALVSNNNFIDNYWQKKPLLITSCLQNLKNGFTMEDVRTALDSDFLEAGRGSFQQGKSGWSIAAVSQPRGKSFEDAKLRFEDVQMAMKETSGAYPLPKSL
jgi:hypothetical protein